MSVLPTRLLALADARGPACHGYQNGCVCERCGDRNLRFVSLTHEGQPNAATEAMRQSAEYFETPWRYRAEPGRPPQPLRC